MSKKEIRVPDIGDFKDVPVIEVHVKPGATVAQEDALITLESDKASFDVPAPEGGRIVELLVKVGDKVSEGSPILTLEADGDAADGKLRRSPRRRRRGKKSDRSRLRQRLNSPAMPIIHAKFWCSAPDREAILQRSVPPTLAQRRSLSIDGPALGGVCLNVGCIPSKALLHTAFIIDAAAAMGKHGITFAAPKIDLKKLAAYKDGVVAKLTGGLASMAKARKVTTLRGTGTFVDAHHLKVVFDDGREEMVRFETAIIAAGSEAVALPFMPSDPRIVDSTGALELRTIPDKMLVIGGGIIGLEMATVYSTLGARLDVVELLDTLMTGADRDLVNVWQKVNARRFDKVMLKTKVVGAEAKPDGIYVTFEGADGAGRAAALRHGARCRRTQAERQGDRCKQCRRRSVGARLRSGRQADADEHPAHLCHRRHRGRADAGSQGGPSGPCRCRERGGEEKLFRCPADPVRRLYRSRDRLGRADGNRSQGARHCL